MNAVSIRTVRVLCLVLAVGIASGCRHRTVDATGVGAAVATAPLADASVAAEGSLERAPAVFQASGLARWNGRRTARGVWVAHPDVRAPMQVRVVNASTGKEVDGIVYRQRGSDAGDVLTVSSDTAKALGMTPGQEAQLSLFALRPKPAVRMEQRQSAESKAQQELAAHIAGLDQNNLLQVVAAAMRGMGYVTTFEPLSERDTSPSIHAFSRPGEANLPSIRVMVRAGGLEPISRAEVARHQALSGKAGEIGIIVSVPGFARDAGDGILAGRSHVELVDRDTLMNIWLTHYDRLSEPDRSLLRLQPVYFLAGG